MMDDMGEDGGGGMDASSKLADEHLQNLLYFSQEHEATLREVERALGESMEEAAAPAAASAGGRHAAVSLATMPTERVFTKDLIRADNELLRKVTAVLTYLCDEIHQLEEAAEDSFYGTLMAYGLSASADGDGAGDGGGAADAGDGDRGFGGGGPDTMQIGDAEKQMGRVLSVLQELSNFVDRCYAVAVNTVQQLAALYNPRERLYVSTFKDVHLLPVFTMLGDLLKILITLDAIVDGNEMLQAGWAAYKNMIHSVRADPAQFGLSEEQVSSFERMLVSIDQTIMTAQMFRGCIEQNFEVVETDEGDEQFVSVRGCQQFMDEFMYCIRARCENTLSVIDTATESTERQELVGIFALYALHRALLPNNVAPDPRTFRKLWSVQKLVPFVPLQHQYGWYPGEFLEGYAAIDTRKVKLDPPNVVAFRRTYVTRFDEEFSQQVRNLHLQTTLWVVLMDARMTDCLRFEGDVRAALDARGTLVLKGIALAHRTSNLAANLLALHTNLVIPMNKRVVRPLCMCFEILKAIEFTFVRKEPAIAETLVHMTRQIIGSIMVVTVHLRAKLESERKFDDNKLDILAAVHIVECVLGGSETLTFPRQIVVDIGLMICMSTDRVREADQSKLRSLLRRLLMLNNAQRLIRSACDCGFLYWHRELLGPFLDDVYKHPTEVGRLQYILSAFGDSIKLLKMVAHQDAGQFLKAYRDFLTDTLDEHIIEPLCRDIENDLRVHIHTKNLTHMHTINPKKQNLSAKVSLLETGGIRVLGDLIDIRQRVTTYLERVFYNLTTVALHDWKTYAEMRNLAHEKFGLTISENFLPMGGLDQGLDVLQIMRNIHVFVARFSYNLNMQCFIEYRTDQGSKHINTISIQSIAASLRQHGLGILNTTVNFTYQFLTRKFHIFSQFLFDDYIRSHLSKDVRWYKKNKDKSNQKYPFDRALGFSRDIRRLGVSDAGKTFLDQFRILITEIGNALGYVRMVRSAATFYCSEAVKFLPELGEYEDDQQPTLFEALASSGIEVEAEGAGSDSGGGDNSSSTENGAAAGAGDEQKATEGAADGDAAQQQQKKQADEEEAKKKDPTRSARAAIAQGHNVEGAHLAEPTVHAARNLDTVVATLVRNFSEGNDFFKVLVGVFQQTLLGESEQGSRVDEAAPAEEDANASRQRAHKHLSNFYMIVPSLCISWVESSLQAKDAMYKSSRSTRDAYFTDDGFAMGVAYILAILKQDRKFDSLHWFDSVRSKLRQDGKELKQREAVREHRRAELEKKKRKKSGFSMFRRKKEEDDEDIEEAEADAEEVHTLQMTAKRLEANRRETELLGWSLNGARIFFKRTSEDL